MGGDRRWVVGQFCQKKKLCMCGGVRRRWSVVVKDVLVCKDGSDLT